ncbi:hypothetical protein EYR40_004872 [Pleurotus pulmonarius]|nr:hypothetical protein EYR40_004872 [Pleurotus pulmonarius]
MMDEDVVPVGQPREKTAPFLIRAFIKIGNFHRLTLFDDGTLPTTDEQQLFTWKDATLREIVTTIRNTAPTVPEYRHPLARFSFRTVYADPGNKGRFSSKELGSISSREILGDSGTLTTVAPRLLEDEDTEPSTREREERTLDELRFVPGDYLIVAVHLPKSVTAPSELAIKGAGTGPNNGWKSGTGRGADSGWGGPTAASGAPGRGGGHWRGDSNPPPPGGGRGRGRGGDRGGDFDRRVPPPRRGESPPRGGRGGRQRSRTRSPRRRRYD